METAPFIVVVGNEEVKAEGGTNAGLTLLCESSSSQQLLWNPRCMKSGIISGSTVSDINIYSMMPVY
jgi:hypothetical protein